MKVRNLNWVQNWYNEPDSQWALVETIDRSYSIDPENHMFNLTTSQFPSGEYGSDDLGTYPTLDAAKNAAQADFDHRILECLTDEH